MSLLRFSDRVTDDTTLKKVFLGSVLYFARSCARLLSLFILLFIYKCHRCHKWYRPLFAGLPSMTVSNCFLSSVTVFPVLGTADRRPLSSVLCFPLCAGGVL
jgi:hypothetical protein